MRHSINRDTITTVSAARGMFVEKINESDRYWYPQTLQVSLSALIRSTHLLSRILSFTFNIKHLGVSYVRLVGQNWFIWGVQYGPLDGF